MRLAIAALASLVLALPVLSVTAAGVFRRNAAELVLSVASYDARSKASAAQQLLFGKQSTLGAPGGTTTLARPSASAVSRAERHALSAFRRDATAIRALTVLGMIAGFEQDGPKAARLFRLAESLSRRDDQTQLWLIEQRVASNDIQGAIRHYDTILRTSPELWQLLFTILARASSEPAIAREVNVVLRRKPRWWSNFLHHVHDTTGDPVALSTLSRGVLDPSREPDLDLARRLMARLVHDDVRRYDLAWAAYAELAGRQMAAQPLRDPRFARERLLPPLDWEFSSDAALLPERRAREGATDGYSLYLPAAPRSDGTSARQLLWLGPGRHRLTALVGNIPDDPAHRPHIRVQCARSRGGDLIDLALPPAGPTGLRVSRQFSVGRDCPFQWLSINVRGTFDPPAAEDGGWIDFVQAA